MNSSIPPLRFSAGTHDQFAKEYLKEIDLIARTAEHPVFEKIVTNYDLFCKTDQPEGDVGDRISRITEQTYGASIVDVKKAGRLVEEALVTAHLASCSHFLHGSMFPLANLKRPVLLSLAEKFLRTCENKPEDYRSKLVHKFHTMDTLRVIYFLRALGLISRPSENMYQLGIGAAEGTRDIIAVHLVPRVNIIEQNGTSMIAFDTVRKAAAETIIVDSEFLYKDHYETLNKDESLNVTAYNDDTISTLRSLASEIEHKRNLITGLRIDHRMLKDVPLFFHYLAPCIDDACDLVLTIGAGDTVSDFKGRIDKFEEIHSALSSCGLLPLIFRFHGRGSVRKQKESLYFGNVRASSYEVLYCRLSSKVLAKHFQG